MPRVDSFGDSSDRPALPSGVSTFENHDNALTFLVHTLFGLYILVVMLRFLLLPKMTIDSQEAWPSIISSTSSTGMDMVGHPFL